MIETSNVRQTPSRVLVVRGIIFVGVVLVVVQANLFGQTFKSTAYQTGSSTAGIQEAIDAASKGGGGTVQIPAGTFVLRATAGHPAIILRSRVSVVGAGPESTILRLAANSKASPSVMANQNYDNPDAGEPDHDISLQGFTIDVAASDQVLRETELAEAIPGVGEYPVVLKSADVVGAYPLFRIEPGPDEEIVPIMKMSPGSLRTLFMHPHPRGAKVVSLVQRLHGLALVGTLNVTVQNVTIQNAPMDGIYLSNTASPVLHRTYTRKVNIERCSFIACHRNGISVIDAEDVTIAQNNFRDITGGAIDIEPNHPEQHGNRITIQDNKVLQCYIGISLSLQFSGPTSANFREEVISRNTIERTLYGWGIYVLWQQAGAIISRNTITDVAGDGISLIGSSQVKVTQNIITNVGRCLGRNDCATTARAAGIRLLDGAASHIANRNTLTENTIKDLLHIPMLLYGVDFSSTGTGNTVRGNVVSRFDPHRGMIVHVSGRVGSNTISGNSRE